MGNHKRKRKSPSLSQDDGLSSAKSFKPGNVPLFLDDLHEEPFRILSDLLTEKNLVFVEGPVGCGKTSLVRRVAEGLDLPVKVFQLSDQIDSKTFIGSYQCTEVPGEFVWEPSIFSQSVFERCLILLEDLDSASPDLVSSLLLMVKTWSGTFRNEDLPSEFHPEMRIVATVRSENNHGESSELIRSHPLSILLQNLTTEELKEVVDFQFPSLASISAKLLAIFTEVSTRIKEDSLIDRELNSSDLIRACRRLSKLSSLSDNIEIFNELADVYVLSVSSQKRKIQIAKILGNHLSIPDDRIEFVLCKRAPDIIVDSNIAQFGRVKLAVKRGRFSGELTSKRFGLTLDARLLVERIAACVDNEEAVLLTGETGVGKTSVVQLVAAYLNVELEVVNMSQDSDSADLIGGFKPIGTLELLTPLLNDVEQLFKRSFDMEKNQRFLSHFTTLLSNDRFFEFLELCEVTAKKIIDKRSAESLSWADILVRSRRLSRSLRSRKSALPFAYVEGIVSKAAKNGHWLLVDEVNLASSECLDAIVHVLDGVIERHPDFRLFACMNPATDTGKKKLPVGIRSRFTEFFVMEPTDRDQLSVIVRNYLPDITARNLMRLLDFYESSLSAFPRKYSLRNLCRALSFAGSDLFGNPYRSLFEGVSMAFGSDLDNETSAKFEALLKKYFVDVPAGIPRPTAGKKQILIEGSYIELGDNVPDKDPNYVYTESITKNLAKLARAVASGKFPVLLEGETSAGKTSMIMNLALMTGNIVHRINNHEHTDIQEYIGCYAPGEDGKLTFIEGVLLQAVRLGHWVILDELNLAPVEVLEALNRLLDDNRELFVAERNLVVKAHPRFRLFATQNPVGTYAGRKRLSRAFLNRFIVLRFDHPPFEELAKIVQVRCAVPESAANAMIKVLTELKRFRSQSGLFNSSDGLMTLRDLFRWANRLSKSESGEWRQVLADQGYFLLAARCRNTRDSDEIVRVLEKILKVKVDPEKLFSNDSPYLPFFAKKELEDGNSHVVATLSMRRMLILSSEAWKCSEPILMVGETGCGKTTAAQILSMGNLLSINCHERTETSDLLGSIRPNFDGSFFWQDGVVVQAMKKGLKLLIDEISLAADSVLERLNPLLESTRTVLLTDAGADAEIVVAHRDFQVVATMNPGTDHGKKELSKALRNRFTEIWCSCDHPVEDIKQILTARLKLKKYKLHGEWMKSIDVIVEFFMNFNRKFGPIFRTVFSIRDIIAAADLFVACCTEAELSLYDSLLNCLSGVVLDSIGVLPARTIYDAVEVKEECLNMLKSIISSYGVFASDDFSQAVKSNCLYFGLFHIEYGCVEISKPKQYSFDTPTTKENLMRVARALLLEKPIMLEGSPGAGKSSLIVALAEATGHSLVRLNLSDQTDLSDLFGHDVPISRSDGSISFQWQDGPVLKAIKEGSWILLDEMNLASQSVLEGLNSCFDFRQELFIAELNKTFTINSKKCRFFACQNPQQQGGNRRALPKSFLNRFTSIYIQPFKNRDFLQILDLELVDKKELTRRMVLFNKSMQKFVRIHSLDFEFNMRDLLRWAEFISVFKDEIMGAEILYISRFPLNLQKEAREIFSTVFGVAMICPRPIVFFNSHCGVCFGDYKYNLSCITEPELRTELLLLPSQLKLLQELVACLKMNWLVLLNGPRLAGKSSLVEILATLTGRELKRMKLNKETDASELLGTYEQVIDNELLTRLAEEFLTMLTEELLDIDQEVKRKVISEMTDVNSVDIRSLRSWIDQVSALTMDKDSLVKLDNLQVNVSKIYLRFEWKSSVFVDAYRDGHWILIEDVNCCSAAVLDRLNSCLESGGKLVLPEQADGSVEEIKPHPGFRIFFTMDRKNGPLSRAMKNRSVEFSINEENGWYGDRTSALNVLLKKEKVMCSAVEEGKVDSHPEIVKKSLLLASLSKITEEERLNALDPNQIFTPGSKEGLSEGTDKVSLVPINPLVNRQPCILLDASRQERMPPVDLVTFSVNSVNGFTPTALLFELKAQEFDRMANLVIRQLGNNSMESEYCLAGFCLALLSTSSEILSKSRIFEFIFDNLDMKVKEKLIAMVIRIIPKNMDCVSPWDIRFFQTAVKCSFVEHDPYLFEFIAQWLKYEAEEIKKRMHPESPLAISNALHSKQLTLLSVAEYNYLAPVCFTLVEYFGSMEFNNLELNEEVFNNISEFIFNVAVLIHSGSLENARVHQLLILRQCLQNLEIENLNSKTHPIWRNFRFFLKNDETRMRQVEKLIKSIGISHVVDHEKYLDVLENITFVQPFLNEDEYATVGTLVQTLHEDYIKAKTRMNSEKILLKTLVKGLEDFLKSFVVIKRNDLINQNWFEFPDVPLQFTELISLFNFKNEEAKNSALFVSLMNSKLGMMNVAPQLTNFDVTNCELLIDILCKFWEGFRYSMTSFSAIPIADLASASERIAEYQSLIWTTRKIYRRYREVVTQGYSDYTSCFVENTVMIPSVLFKKVNMIFKQLAPPKGMIDPGLEGLVILEVARYRERILQLFNSFSNVFPAEYSAHPIVRYIHDSFVKTIMEIKKMEEEQNNVYRISHLRFDDFTKEYHSFLDRWEIVSEDYNIKSGSFSPTTAFSFVIQHATRTKNMIQLAQAFSEKLIFGYSDMPDIVVPVYIVLQTLLNMLNHQAYIADRFLKLKSIGKEQDVAISKVDGRIRPEMNVFEDFSLLEFSLSGRGGLMPMQFQFELAKTVLSKTTCDDVSVMQKEEAFNWFVGEWNKWYEGHKEKRAKMFVYKETGALKEKDEEETMIDPEDLEIQAMLPTFDEEEIEPEVVETSRVLNRVPDARDLCKMIQDFIYPKDGSVTLYPIVWLLQYFNHTNALVNPHLEGLEYKHFVEDSRLMDHHLLVLSEFRESLGSKPMKRIINVYTENDKAEVIRCANAMRKLEARVHEVQVEFPEDANLKLIDDTISIFLNVDCGVPQLKLANYVEKVLEKSELWQKISPKQYSLGDQLDELQEILLDWRKMQVQSWQHIINSMADESHAIALTMGYPLIETLINWRDNEPENLEVVFPNYISMFIEWIQSSTLVDFKARLEIADLIYKVVTFLFKDKEEYLKLAENIKAVQFYFQAYQHEVEEKLKTKRMDVVQDLENFVNIVKFHDLNLWSIKNSAEKAHSKLFRIIKRYKQEGNEQLETLFVDFLPIPNPPMTVDVRMKPTLFQIEDRLNFANFFTRFSNVLLSMPGLHEPEDLFDFCSSYQEILGKDVIYNESDDEANEKLQGQALFDRQRRFALLVKNSAKFGFRSRRGAQLSSEEILKSSLTMDAKESGLDEICFRSCAVVRNMVMRIVNQLNANKQPHILKQVTVQMISHIRGLTEFGFSYLLNVVSTFKKLNQNILLIRRYKEELGVFADIAKLDKPCFTISGEMNSLLADISIHAKDVKGIAKMIVDLISAVPDHGPKSESDLMICLKDDALHKEHKQYSDAVKSSNLLFAYLDKLSKLCDDYEKKVVHGYWDPENGKMFILEAKKLVESAFLASECGILKEHFDARIDDVREYLTEIKVRLDSSDDINFDDTMDMGSATRIESDFFQRKVQQIYKAVDSKVDLEEAPVDVFKKIVIALSSGIEFSKETNALDFFLNQLTHGYTCSKMDILRYYRLTTEMLESMELAQHVLSQFANWTANFYIKLGHVNTRILKKGLVNSIPKKEEGEGGQGKEMEDVGGENCGMGEGEGAKDVGGEIDETGQVEDLKNDEDESKGNEPQEKQKDSETPLDMEDDFAADLENVDADDNEKGDDQDKDEGEDQNEDWDMGNVNEPEENQLDPLLWDKPQQEEKNLDDKADGADDKTDELAAKENDDTVAREDEGKEDQKEEDKEEEEEHEELDLENANKVDANDESEDESGQPEKMDEEIDQSVEQGDEEEEGKEGEKVDDEEIDEGNSGESDNEEEKDMEPEQNDEMQVDEGAQPEDIEKSTQGQSVGDEQKKQDSTGGEVDEQEMEDSDAKKAETTNEDKSSGKEDTQKAAKTASDVESQKKPENEMEEDSEGVNEKKNHAQPTEDDAMEIDLTNEQPDEAMENDEIDPDSNQLAHIADDKKDARDQYAVQKSTIEEALSTKSQYEKIKPNYEDHEVVPNDTNEAEEEKAVEIVQQEDFELTMEEKKHTVIHVSTDLFDLSQQAVKKLNLIEVEVNSSVAETNDPRIFAALSDSISLMASELAENLRQILEPSIANRLQGDYRTGKRLNMRRLVSYIASDYRKNRIWMRRTKKQQRNFQIMVAVDDSKSMGDNRMGEITCQSVCLIEKAFRQLEVGQLSICKFGQEIQMLRDFASATDAQDTLVPSLLANLCFDQNKTDLLGLLSFAAKSFESARESSSSALPVQMLVIIGDGHGVFSQGKDPLVNALKELEHQRITVLYVIVDGKNSVLNMSHAVFENGKPKLTPYIAVFPFPFYALVRTTSALPGTLAEAIRQWFEMTMRE